MKYKKIQLDEFAAEIEISTFAPDTGVAEFHVMINLNDATLSACQQISNMDRVLEYLGQLDFLQGTVLVWKRYLLSDIINQQSYLPKDDLVAVSLVGQPPLNGNKVALWCYYMKDCGEITVQDNTLIVKRPHYTHYYTTGLHALDTDEYVQTASIFDDYNKMLQRENMTLSNNLLRTWIYVQAVDVHYTGMVNARKAIFDQCGLTHDTHYVASTGIEGRYIYSHSVVFMDAYAVKGIVSEQVRYLYAPTHLSSTYKYGVTFERATALDYGDRRHIFVSGTASIDKEGDIVAPLDIVSQTKRTLENIDELLKEGNAAFDDLAHLIVYFRDIADYCLVKEYLNSVLPNVPKIMLQAPVCRPGWLIEMECMAICRVEANPFKPY